MDRHAAESGAPGGTVPARARHDLSLRFACDHAGRTYIARQFARYPFHVCKLLHEDPELPGMGTIYTQSSSGGLYEHERHSVEISADGGARAHVTSQASTIVHSMAGGEARQELVISAAAGSHLEIVPDPQILFPGSAYAHTVRINVEESAAVVFSDSFLTHDPEGTSRLPRHYWTEITVANGTGKLLAVDRMAIDGTRMGHGMSGIMGVYRGYGTMLIIAPSRDRLTRDAIAPEAPPDNGAALIGMSALPCGAGLLFRVLARDGAELKGAMARCWAQSRLALAGRLPRMRRK